MYRLRIGSRGSELALAQARRAADALRRVEAVECEIVTIKTRGDETPEAVPGVGVFVREIEKALLACEVDTAVHSMKDIPTKLAEGTAIAAVLERDDWRDVLVSRGGLHL